jgi:Protein of unknown function (DUF1552)
MKQLDRRTFLRGAGAALSLPLLEAMAPIGKTALAQDAAPARIMAYYVPCGIRMNHWTPTAFGKDYTLSRTLSPLEKVKDQLLVLKGLDGRGPMDSQMGGAHSSGTGAFITGVQVQKGQQRGAISMDQIAANALGARTKLDCLVTGIENGLDGESGYNGIFLHNISFVNGTTPRPKMTNPTDVFNKIVGGGGGGAPNLEAQRRIALKKSVLDYVADDATKLSTRLGQNDKIRMDEYLTRVRKIEQDLGSGEIILPGCSGTDPGQPNGRVKHVEIMAQLQALAFECDATRIQTFMLADGGTYTTYGFLDGVDGGHHGISHSGDDKKISTIDYWEIQMFAYLLELLKNTRDPSGKSLLESCAVYFGNEISDGNRHNCDDLPVLLAGGCNGYFATGQHIDVTGVKYTNVLLSMLNAFGVEMEKLGNSTGPFTQGMA